MDVEFKQAAMGISKGAMEKVSKCHEMDQIPRDGPHGTSRPGLTILNTAMVNMMAVVMTVREIRGQGWLAMMPDDFKSHRREADAFLLHC